MNPTDVVLEDVHVIASAVSPLLLGGFDRCAYLWWVAIAAFGVVQGLRLSVAVVHQKALRVFDMGAKYFQKGTAFPDLSGSKRRHRTWLDECLCLLERVVVLDQNWQMVLGIAVPVAIDRFDAARWKFVADS